MLTVVFALLDLMDRYRALDRSVDIVARLEEHPRPVSRERGLNERLMPPGSPFLEGRTATVAGAAILQRVLSAIARAGGNVASSDVVQQDARASDRYVEVNVTCELKQEALQPLLYDLEAGMPFLFVNQFVVDVAPAGGGRTLMHVSLEVSGLWRGAQ